MFLSILLFFNLNFGLTQELLFESGQSQVSLIELYSSEGCSSCPPADRWIAGLKSHKKLWKDFVPLNFHVDYWNQLGWVDRFANQKFTKRQRQFASLWKSTRVYTPGFIKDGKEWKTRKMINLGGSSPGNLVVSKQDNSKLKIEFSPREKLGGTIEVNVALLGNGLSTNVKYGENAGETLKHEFVVLDWKNEPMIKQQNGKYYKTIARPVAKTKGVESYSLAVWVNIRSNPTPIQATGGPINLK